jgi:hypothetical protein
MEFWHPHDYYEFLSYQPWFDEDNVPDKIMSPVDDISEDRYRYLISDDLATASKTENGQELKDLDKILNGLSQVIRHQNYPAWNSTRKNAVSLQRKLYNQNLKYSENISTFKKTGKELLVLPKDRTEIIAQGTSFTLYNN